jgi:ribosomal 50S subunit-associated protein YjgA (DUF615 family)
MEDRMDIEENGQAEAQAEETAQVEDSQQTSAETAPQETTGGDNPAWNPIREALGDVGYHAIKPHLHEWDKSANKRISEVNAKYEPWKAFESERLSPDKLRAAFSLQQQMEQIGAEGLYAQLREALKQQGRLPAEEAAAQQEQSGEEDGEDLDPMAQELSTLREQQAQFQQYLQEQAAQKEYETHRQQFESKIDQSIKQIQSDHPEFSKRDLQMILSNAAAEHGRTGQEPDLMKLASDLADYRSSILNTPRPNDSAPRLPGAGGGNLAGQQVDPSKLDTNGSVELFANLLKAQQSG